MKTIFRSPVFKQVKNLLFGLGASVVIFGALGKLTHAPWANQALTIGLITEAVIFAISGIIPPEPDYYWEQLYPGLDKHKGMSTKGATPSHPNIASNGLHEFMNADEFNPEQLKFFRDNFKKLGSSIEQLTDLTDSFHATNTFNSSALSAAEALSSVRTNYEAAGHSLSALLQSSDAIESYSQQLKTAENGLKQLSVLYSEQFTACESQLKAMNNFVTSVQGSFNKMSESVEDVEIYQTNIRKLSQNMIKLNSVYDNMLVAMRA